MSVRTVVFDLGGVVVRVCRTWGEACAQAGVEVRSPERFAGFELRERRSSLSDAYQSGAISSEAYFRGISEATDGLYTPAEVERVHRAWVMGDYPGVAALMDRLHGAGLTTACLSNTNASHWEDLLGGRTSEATGLIQRPLVSHELGAVKPDLEIYARAEAALGVSRDELVFFDDLVPNVEGALAAGWNAHRVDHEGDPAAQVTERLRALGVID